MLRSGTIGYKRSSRRYLQTSRFRCPLVYYCPNRVLSCKSTSGCVLCNLQISMQCTSMSQLWNSSIVSWQSWGWRREETRPAICMVTAPGQHRQPAPAWDGITKLSFNQRRQPALELTWHQCSRAANHLHFTASMHHHHPQSVVTRVTLYWRQDKIKMCIILVIATLDSWLWVLAV